MTEEAYSGRRNIIIIPIGLECSSTPLVVDEEDYKIIQNILRFYKKHDSLVEDLRPDDDSNGPTNNDYQKFRFNAGGRGYIRIKEDDDDRRINKSVCGDSQHATGTVQKAFLLGRSGNLSIHHTIVHLSFQACY